ncbi:MAG: flagellar motor switch protein FliN [Candidatus Omnitrophica bacterium]|nr:flagellar motor switch protein FliN [Candidatus Omnitrophota bacterium]MCM8826394.1 flagellar motor switch protein FliN [Candidatus Omnitrophota bacterium]
MNGNLTQKDLEILKNINVEIGKKISKFFSTLIGRNAHIFFKEAGIYSLNNLSTKFQQEFLCLKYLVNQDNNKSGLFILPKRLVFLLSELLLSRRPVSIGENLSPQQIEIFVGGWKKVLEAYGLGLEQILGEKFTFSLQDYKQGLPLDSLKDISLDKDLFISEFSLGIEGFFEDNFYEVISSNFAKEIVSLAINRLTPQGGKIGKWSPSKLTPESGEKSTKDISLLLDTPLQLSVELGRSKMTIKDILELGIGSIIELDKLAGEPVDIKVNNKLLAKGEVVVIDENFGVRIVSITKPNERI